MHVNRILFCGLVVLIILLILPVGSLGKDTSTIVNVMIDVNSFSSPTPDQVNITHTSLINLTNAIDAKRLNATYYLSGEAIPVERLYLTYLGESPRRELAMGGMTANERLESVSQSKQRELLEKMKKYVKACHVCGGKTIDPVGFKPQSASQNGDTYKILHSMGIAYDAGFRAGLLYLPGHENDTWPYRVENYNLYAVPVSSYDLSGDRVYLSDRYIKEEKKLSSSQWYDILVGKFDESSNNKEPLVVIFDNLVSGQDTDLLDTYKRFIDYATSKDATFVTSMELVNMSIARDSVGIIQDLNGGSISANDMPSNCTICDTLKNVTLEVAENDTNATDSGFVKPVAMPKPVFSE